MQTFADISAFKEQILNYKRDGKIIGFVPTMGNLHEGHLTLIKKSQEKTDITVVSLFVNPMQFERNDDLVNYPRTLDDDLAKLINLNVDLVFTPTSEEMYPKGMEQHTLVDVPNMSSILEGASRPGHFRGVSTVVTKLFHIVKADVAFFGEKDFQQLAIIRQMVSDLSMDVEIVGIPTVRELDGLAMSSRNNLLTLDERQRAPVLARTMRWISSTIRGGRNDFESIIEDAIDQLRAADLQPDQIEIRDAITLQPAIAETKQIVILMSAFLGKIRLIDNQTVELSIEKETTESERSELIEPDSNN